MVLIAAAASVFSSGEAWADELQNKLVAAMRATRTDALSFQRSITIERTGSARKLVVERYDPRRPVAERWSLVSIDGRAPNAKEADQSRKAKRGPVPSYAELADWFGASATRIDTMPGYVTYRFAQLPAGAMKIGSHDASADTKAEAFVNVKGPTPYVERVRFTSSKSFRMMMVASVQSMDVTSRYEILRNGGIVPQGEASTITGSLLGKSGQIKTAVTYVGFQSIR
jgi:hypothetical protein